MNQLLSRKLTFQIAKPKLNQGFAQFPKYCSSQTETPKERVFPKGNWFIKNSLCSLTKMWKNWMIGLDAKCANLSEVPPPPASDSKLNAEVLKYRAWMLISVVRKNMVKVQQSDNYKNVMKSATATLSKYEDMASDYLEKTFKEQKK